MHGGGPQAGHRRHARHRRRPHVESTAPGRRSKVYNHRSGLIRAQIQVGRRKGAPRPRIEQTTRLRILDYQTQCLLQTGPLGRPGRLETTLDVLPVVRLGIVRFAVVRTRWDTAESACSSIVHRPSSIAHRPSPIEMKWCNVPHGLWPRHGACRCRRWTVGPHHGSWGAVSLSGWWTSSPLLESCGRRRAGEKYDSGEGDAPSLSLFNAEDGKVHPPGNDATKTTRNASDDENDENDDDDDDENDENDENVPPSPRETDGPCATRAVLSEASPISGQANRNFKTGALRPSHVHPSHIIFHSSSRASSASRATRASRASRASRAYHNTHEMHLSNLRRIVLRFRPQDRSAREFLARVVCQRATNPDCEIDIHLHDCAPSVEVEFDTKEVVRLETEGMTAGDIVRLVSNKSKEREVMETFERAGWRKEVAVGGSEGNRNYAGVGVRIPRR